MTDIPWTWLKIDGQTILDRTAGKIRVSYRWIEAGGKSRRLANGVKRKLRRRQFRKRVVTISGEAARKPAIDHLCIDDVAVFDIPAHMDLPGYVPENDLPVPAVEGSIVYFGQANGEPVILEAGDPGIIATGWRPRLTIMIDQLDVEEEEGTSVRWSITGEEV